MKKKVAKVWTCQKFEAKVGLYALNLNAGDKLTVLFISAHHCSDHLKNGEKHCIRLCFNFFLLFSTQIQVSEMIIGLGPVACNLKALLVVSLRFEQSLLKLLIFSLIFSKQTKFCLTFTQ